MGLVSKLKKLAGSVTNAVTKPLEHITSVARDPIGALSDPIGTIKSGLSSAGLPTSVNALLRGAATGGTSIGANWAQINNLVPGGLASKINTAAANPSAQVRSWDRNLKNSLTPAQLKFLDIAAASQSGFISDAVSAVREGGGAGKVIDRWVDPGGSIDYSLRRGGEELPEGVRAVAPGVGTAIGSIWGPLGSAAGAGVGSKLAGQSYNQGWKNAGIGLASSYAGGLVGGGVTGATGSQLAGGVAGGATSGGVNAAATGQNIGQGMLVGSVAGGIGSQMAPVSNALSQQSGYNFVQTNPGGISPNTAGMIVRPVFGAASGAAINAIRDKDITQGAVTGAIGGAATGLSSAGSNYIDPANKYLSVALSTLGRIGANALINNIYSQDRPASQIRPVTAAPVNSVKQQSAQRQNWNPQMQRLLQTL